MNELVVLLGAAVVGRVARSSGRLRFQYDDAYRRRPDATPLSLSMPLTAPEYPDGVISPWLAGLLPENLDVLRGWARRFHTSTAPFSLLSAPIGHDCAGAVRFVAPAEVEEALERRGRVKWLTEAEVAARLHGLKVDATAWLGPAFTGQFSLAGAQAKTALLYRRGRWGEPTGATPTSHILKPAIAGLDDHDLNEHLCLEAARRVGLVVAKTRVAGFGSESAIVVERYDRQAVSGELTRIHQEDLCQALGFPPSMKYQNEGGPSVKQISELLRNAILEPVARADAVQRFLDALAWNWLIAGTDAHAKNYSLLLSGRQVRLAPLYDIASALPYGHAEQKLRFAMKLGGDYGVFPRRDPWRRLAREVGLDEHATVERVRELAARVPDAFADAARSEDIARLRRPLSARLVQLVAARAARCSQLLNRKTRAGPSSQAAGAGQLRSAPWRQP